MPSFIEYIINEYHALLTQTAEHIGLTTFSLTIALLIGIPTGVFISKKTKWAGSVLAGVGILQTIPSIALLGFMIPLLGIGMKPAIFALFLYALLPLVRNTFTGLSEIDKNIVEAAKGMGMTQRQLFFKIELPLALPMIFAGVRTAAVINIGVATLAAYIAAGGLGEFIFGGIALNNSDMILAGAIPSALLAIIIDFLLARLQKMPTHKMWQYGLVFLLITGSIGIYSYLPKSSASKTTKVWKAGFEPEFVGREDGMLGLKKKYNLSFDVSMLNATLMYEALQGGDVDLISGYSTDGRIKAFNLAVLEDDRFIFPPYQAAPLMSAQSVEENPEVVAELSKLEGLLTDSIMTELNYTADYLKRSPEEIAIEFVERFNLLNTNPAEPSGKEIAIGSKIFTEQYILVEIFSQLITHNLGHTIDRKTGLGGTKICFDALREGEIDVYPEYTGTGFLVMLKPSQPVIDSLIQKPVELQNYVYEQFEREYNLKWLPPLGFNNTYAIMVRKKMAEELNLKNISDLK